MNLCLSVIGTNALRKLIKNIYAALINIYRLHAHSSLLGTTLAELKYLLFFALLFELGVTIIIIIHVHA
jgi:hypothetical protein